jgi:hypothetical protein
MPDPPAAYNRFHDPGESAAGIARLRELHVVMDYAQNQLRYILHCTRRKKSRERERSRLTPSPAHPLTRSPPHPLTHSLLRAAAIVTRRRNSFTASSSAPSTSAISRLMRSTSTCSSSSELS